MKKILFYTNGIYRGGIEIALENLISHLNTSKYKIYVTELLLCRFDLQRDFIIAYSKSFDAIII